MTNRRKFLAVGAAAALSACARRGGEGPDMSRLYVGPPVTSIQVFKGARRMYLVSEGEVLRRYTFDLGFRPDGSKRFEGDGRTPEGDYYINRRNPRSAYYLSLGISYPNAADIAAAEKAGRSPGGDIFIHGEHTRWWRRNAEDWTAGCIAVKNEEIREMYWMVRLGTPIRIVA